MNENFPKPNYLGANLKIELDLSNYTTKTDLNNGTGVDTSYFAKNTDLVNLKSDVDNLDIDKLKNIPTNLNDLKSKVHKLDIGELQTTPVDFSKLSDEVKNDVVKKYVYNAKIKNIEDKIPDITKLATKTTLNSKINEVKSKTSSITNLATDASNTAVENKTPNFGSLVKKTDYNTDIKETGKKITNHDHSNKYITTPKFNKLTAGNVAGRLKEAMLQGLKEVILLIS